MTIEVRAPRSPRSCYLNRTSGASHRRHLLDAVGLVEGEKVQVLNVNNGERLETYAMDVARAPFV
jgi:aspartate 1-decarboxylase